MIFIKIVFEYYKKLISNWSIYKLFNFLFFYLVIFVVSFSIIIYYKPVLFHNELNYLSAIIDYVNCFYDSDNFWRPPKNNIRPIVDLREGLATIHENYAFRDSGVYPGTPEKIIICTIIVETGIILIWGRAVYVLELESGAKEGQPEFLIDQVVEVLKNNDVKFDIRVHNDAIYLNTHAPLNRPVNPFIPRVEISAGINPLNKDTILGVSLHWGETLFKRHRFTSNMIKTEDLTDGYYRLLTTDHAVTLPYGSWMRVLITSLDVLHSWAIPSLGVKLDACPGRLNQVAVFMKRDGFFYGQCSEICGIYHAFMPISIESINLEAFLFWVYDHSPWFTKDLKAVRDDMISKW